MNWWCNLLRSSAQIAKVCVIFCIWVGFIGPAHSEENAHQKVDVYVGSLAGKEIVLTFAESGSMDYGNLSEEQASHIKAQYFYRKFGKIIPLVEQPNGMLAECTQTFHELNCDKPSGYWSFVLAKQASDTNVSAQWRATPTGSAQLVTLTLVSAKNSSQTNTWTDLLGHGPTKLMGIKTMNGVSAGMLVDVRSGAKVPQLVSGYSYAVMNLFNTKMFANLVLAAASALENQSLDGGQYDNSAIEYASPLLVTTGGSGGAYYGGNHSLDGYSSSTYDVFSGNAIDVRTTFFRHVTPNDYEKFKDKYSFTQIPRKYLKQRNPIENLVLEEIEKFPSNKVPFANKMATGDQSYKDCFEEWQEKTINTFGDDEPAPLQVTKWGKDIAISAFDLMPTQTGLGVYTNDFAEANRGCRSVMLIIPWKKVQPYITKSLNGK